MYTNRGANVPRTSLPCPPRYGNSTRRRFAKALGANHLLVYYRSGGGSTGLRQVRPPLLSHTILTRETGTKIHMYHTLVPSQNGRVRAVCRHRNALNLILSMKALPKALLKTVRKTDYNSVQVRVRRHTLESYLLRQAGCLTLLYKKDNT